MDYEMDHLFDKTVLAAESNILDNYKGKVYSARETSEILGKSLNTVLKYIKLGYLGGALVKNEYRITEDQIKDFQEKFKDSQRIRKSSTVGTITSVDPDSYYNMKEVQLILNRNYNSVWSYIKAGTLVAEKENGQYRVLGKDIIMFMNSSPDTPKRPKRTRTKSSKNYAAEYTKEHYDRIVILMPKGLLPELKSEAESRGTSVSNLFIQAVCEYIGIQPPQKKYSVYGITSEND